MRRNLRLYGNRSIFGLLAILTAIIFCVAAAPINSKTINANAGTTAFSFLKLGVGSQAAAMGGAYVSLYYDPSTLYYNPAGSVYLSGRRFMGGYHNYVMDIQSGFIALTLPAKTLKIPTGTVGFFVSYLNYGDFARMTAEGVPDGSFSGGDFLLGVSYAARWKYGLSFGGNVKFMSEYADGRSAQALAVDLGMMMRLKDSLTSIGLSLSNIGSMISPFGGSTGHKDKLPWLLRAGVSHKPRGLPLVVALDGVIPNDNDPHLNLGTEFIGLKPLYLRAGYSTFGENYKTGSGSNGLGGFSFGFGLDHKRFHFSYAFVPYLDLGSSHRVTFTGEF